MKRNRNDWLKRWRGGGVALLGLAVAGVTACGGTDSRQDVSDEGAPEATAWQTGVSSVTVDSARPARDIEEPRRPVNVSFEEAEAMFRTGDYEEAADLFEAYAERRPDNAWGHYMVGISAWRAGDHVRAEDALRRTVQLDAEHRKGLLNLARVLLERGKAHEALGPVERLVELELQSGEGWRVLGNARSGLGQVDLAVDAYREALVLNTLDSWTMNNLGLLLIRAGRYEEALGPLARATHLRPEVAVFQNNLGIALERSGYLHEASEAFLAALESDPGHERAGVSRERVESRLPGQLQVSVDLPGLARDFEDDVARWRESKERTLSAESQGGVEERQVGEEGEVDEEHQLDEASGDMEERPDNEEPGAEEEEGDGC